METKKSSLPTARDRMLSRLADGSVPASGLTIAELNAMCAMTKASRGPRAVFYRIGGIGYYRLVTSLEVEAGLRIKRLQVVR